MALYLYRYEIFFSPCLPVLNCVCFIIKRPVIYEIVEVSKKILKELKSVKEL